MIDKTLLRTKLLLRFSIVLTIVAWFVFILHHYVGFLQAQIMLRNGQLMTEQAYMIVVGLLLSVTVLQIICFFTYKKNALHDHLPMLISATMTLTSITIIAAGNGLTEYHFSIFVVMALITMFQKRRLIIHSSMTFVAQHLFGYFFFPELLCGTEGYSFSLLGIHAFFLIGITLAALSMIHQLNMTEKQHEELQAASAVKIQALLVEVKEVSALVQEDANDLEHQRGLVMEASNEIAAAVQQTSTQVDETTQLVECADENGQQLRQQMTNIQTITNDIADEATLATKLALQGASSLKDIANQHHTIEESLSMLHELVNDVVENSKYITTEAQVIENVSEQTKLLALNASIEAARAGENGKGFQVVATEVHKLATNSKEATTEILKFIYMIHEKIIHVQEAMQQNKQEVKKGEQLVQATESTFSDIVTQAKNMEQETATINAIIHSTAELTRDMNEAFQMILGANEELSTVSRRALLTSEEQLDQMYELEQVTIRLNTIVKQLNKLMVTSES